MTQRMFILTLLALLTLAVNAWSQTVEFKLVTQKNVTAFSELQILRDELFLGSETIDRVLIADILNDGFDENDMLQL
ncbi:hypothetical protein KKC97_10095 [bacterium]|nr:hypothetical protein [bacterium]